MEIRYLLRVLHAHWKAIFLTALVAGLAGLAATYILGEKYEASTIILIRPHQETDFTPTSKEMMDFPATYNYPPETISQTYAGIMTSAAVATRVVDLLGLDTLTPKPDPRWYVRTYHRVRDWAKSTVKSAWDFVRFGRVEKKDPYFAAVEQVLSGLEAKPIEDTYLFELTASWRDPNVAALVADTAANVFIQYSAKSRISEEGTSAQFLAERLTLVGSEMEQARERLQDFKATTNAASLAEQVNLLLGSLSDFRVSYEDAEKQLRETTAEIQSVEALMEGLKPDIHSSTTMASNPVVLELRTGLARDEVQLASLLETHTSAHPDVKALVARIEEAKSRIAAEDEQVRYHDTSSTNPVYMELEEKLLDRKSARDALQARLNSLRETIHRYEREVGELTQKEAEHGRLELEVAVLADEYGLMSREHAQARLAAAREISEIRALSPAIPPIYPTGPIKIYYAAAGIALGFLASLCVVLSLDYVDPRIRSDEDVQLALGMPVLVTVPSLKASTSQEIPGVTH